MACRTRRDFGWLSAVLGVAALAPGVALATPIEAAKPDREKMIAAVHAYIAAFEKGSLDEVVALFAEDATVEDPVGGPVRRGRDAIRAFYRQPVALGSKLTLDGPIRIAADYAVFPFTVRVNQGGRTMQIEVIDAFRFNARNEVVEMRAFWGPANMRMS